MIESVLFIFLVLGSAALVLSVCRRSRAGPTPPSPGAPGGSAEAFRRGPVDRSGTGTGAAAGCRQVDGVRQKLMRRTEEEIREEEKGDGDGWQVRHRQVRKRRMRWWVKKK